jgi:CYTH domain-containing protein
MRNFSTVAGHMEIERKFLVKQPPPGWRGRNSALISQGYLPIASKDLEIRLRLKDSKHFITIKGGHGRSRQEEEIEIPASNFRALWPLTRTARIAKRRYKIPCDGRTIEMDVYQGAHRGLITADIEFDSLRSSRAFEPPPWLGREITAKRQYSNEKLARSHRLPR